VRFSTRIANALNVAGVKTVGEIRQASDARLLSFQDLGPGSVAQLRETLGPPQSDVLKPKSKNDLTLDMALTGPFGTFPVASARRLRLDSARFWEGSAMGNSKIAIAAYCLAVGFILAIAFHAPSKGLIAANAPVLTPVVDLK
jgi:hypothetical protein